MDLRVLRVVRLHRGVHRPRRRHVYLLDGHHCAAAAQCRSEVASDAVRVRRAAFSCEGAEGLCDGVDARAAPMCRIFPLVRYVYALLFRQRIRHADCVSARLCRSGRHIQLRVPLLHRCTLLEFLRIPHESALVPLGAHVTFAHFRYLFLSCRRKGLSIELFEALSKRDLDDFLVKSVESFGFFEALHF